MFPSLPIFGLLLSVANAAESEIHFNRDIRPILADICLNCHGPDPKSRKADLRLDRFEDATKDNEGVHAILPGKPEASEAIKRIFSADEDEVMPPAKYPRQLSVREKQLLKDWIAQGAKYEAHWAYVLPRKIEPPVVRRQEWMGNPIDRFVLARLNQEGVDPSPAVEKGHALAPRGARPHGAAADARRTGCI